MKCGTIGLLLAIVSAHDMELWRICV